MHGLCAAHVAGAVAVAGLAGLGSLSGVEVPPPVLLLLFSGDTLVAAGVLLVIGGIQAAFSATQISSAGQRLAHSSFT
jgi:hypothetical protein